LDKRERTLLGEIDGFSLQRTTCAYDLRVRPAHFFLMEAQIKTPLCLLFVLGYASLCGVAAAQSGQTDVVSDREKTVSQVQEGGSGSSSCAQLRTADGGVFEHRLDLIRSSGTANRPQATDSARNLQKAITRLEDSPAACDKICRLRPLVIGNHLAQHQHRPQASKPNHCIADESSN
jgi:hypothetical protein